jgi:hypothetical protein
LEDRLEYKIGVHFNHRKFDKAKVNLPIQQRNDLFGRRHLPRDHVHCRKTPAAPAASLGVLLEVFSDFLVIV